MLAQQSPKWICRICLSTRARTQYRQLTQATAQSPNPSKENVTPIPSTSNSNEKIRRVPLSELLARKRDHQKPVPEPAETKVTGAADAEKEQHITPGSTPPQRPWKSRHEGHDKQIPRKPSTSPAKTTVPQKKYSMKLPKKTPEEPVKSESSRPVSQNSVSVSTSTPSDKTETSASAFGTVVSEQSTAAESPPVLDKSTSEPIESRRSKNLEKADTPLPSAPTTRLVHKAPSHRKPAGQQSPLSRARTYVITQTLPDPKIHPADPISQFPEFPGTAAREIVSEEMKANDIGQKIWSESIEMTPIQPKEFRPVPTLEHGLDRVLFK